MKIFKIKNLAHLVMIAFAAASLFNIQAFFYTLEGNIYLAWSLAIALAAVLVVLAGLLSDMKMDLRDSKFMINLVVTAGLTILSGAIQGAAYAEHAGPAGWALGFALPGLGELGLALAISAYARSLDGKEVGEAQRQLANGVRRHLVEAIANVDKSQIEAQVNRAVQKITRELIDATTNDMISELRGNQSLITIIDQETKTADQLPAMPAKTPDQLPANSISEIAGDTSEIASDDPNSTKLNAANNKRQRSKHTGQQELLNIYRANPDLSLREVGKRLDRSPATISAWLKELEENKLITVNGVVHVH